MAALHRSFVLTCFRMLKSTIYNCIIKWTAFCSSVCSGFQVDDKHQIINDTSTAISSISSYIRELDVYSGYNYKLDTGLLNPLVFENLRLLQCLGTIKFIQTDIFKYFDRIDIQL
jgi:hypothetical protein